MAKGFELILDFLVNFKTDKSKIENLAKEVQSALGKAKPEINFDDPKFKASLKEFIKNFSLIGGEVENLQKLISNLKINLDDKEVDEAIKELQRIIQDINKLDLKIVTTPFENINAQVNKIIQSFNEIDETEFKNEIQKLGDAFAKTKQETEQLITKQKLALQALKLTGQEGTQAYQKLEKEIDETEKRLQMLTTSSGKATTGLIERFAVFGLATQGIQQLSNAFEKFLNPFIEFDKQLRNIGTLGVKNFEQFRDAILEVAKRSPDDISQITEGIYNAISAGTIQVKDGMADVSQGIKFVEQASRLAVAGLTDTNSAIKTLSATLNAYGKTTEEAERFSDMLFNTVNRGVTTIPELNSSLSNVIPTAASLDVAFEQVLGALATMTQQGIQTAEATTKLRQLLVELAKPGTQLSKVMEQAGVSLESLKNEGLQVTLQKLGDAMSSMGLQANQVFSSVEAAGAALALTGSNAEKFASILQTYTTEAIGSTQRAFDVASEGIGVKTKIIFNKLEASFFKFFNFIGSGLSSTLALTNQIAPTMMAFGQLGAVLPMDKIKGSFGAISKGITSAIKEAGTLTGVFKNLSSSIASSGGMLASLGPKLMNPYVLAIGAAVAALTLFLTKTEKGQEILKRLEEIGISIYNQIKPLLKTLEEVIAAWLNYVIKLGEALYELIITPFEYIGELIGEVVDAIGGFADETSGTIDVIQFFQKAFEGVKNAIEFVTRAIEVSIYAIKAVKEFIIGFIKAVPELLNVLFDYASYYLNPVNWFSGDKEKEKELSDRLNRVINNALNGVKDTIADAKVNIAIEDALKIKGELDKNKKIDELVEKYKNAKNEIERNTIAQALIKDFPEAIKGYHQIIDENGNVIQAVDINIDKIKQLNDAQREAYSEDLKTKQSSFINGLKEKAGLYDQLSKRADTLAKAIVEGSRKGLDVTGLKKEYNEVTREMRKRSKELFDDLQGAGKIGVEIDKIELPKSVEDEFNLQLIELKQKIKDARFGDEISEMMQIKKKLDEQDNIGDLVKKFKNAKTQIEKESIAKRIKEIAPEAVKEIGVIQDAEGNLIHQYEIQTDKLDEIIQKNKSRYSNELQQKQKEYLDNLSKEADAYTKGQGELKKLTDEINKGKKEGRDTTELERQFNIIQQQMKAQREGILSWGKEAIKNGLDANVVYQIISKTFGITVSEAKELLKAQKESKKAGEEQVEVVDKLKEAWEGVNKAVNEEMDTHLARAYELRRQLKNLKPDSDEAKKITEQYQAEIGEVRKLGKEKKILEEIEKQVQIDAGLRKKEEKDILDIIQKKVEAKAKELELEANNFEFIQDQKIAEEKRKRDDYDDLVLKQKQLEVLEQQKKIWIEELKTKKLLKEITPEGIVHLTVATPKAKEIEGAILELNKKILTESKAIEGIKTKIVTDDEELQKKLAELEEQKIEWEISIGIKGDEALLPFINDLKQKLETAKKLVEAHHTAIKNLLEEQNEKEKKLQDEGKQSEIENLRAEYAVKINTIKKSLEEEERTVINLSQKIKEKEDKIYKDRIEKIKQGENEISQEIENRYKTEEERLKRFNDYYLQLVNQTTEKRKSLALEQIESEEQAKLKELERWRDAEVYSTEAYERRKLEITQEYQKRREKIEEEHRLAQLRASSITRGLELEFERRKEKEKLTLQKMAIEEQIEALKGKAIAFDKFNKPIFLAEEDRKAYTELQEQLTETSELLKVKGEAIGVMATELQTTVTESITNLFAGDTEALKDNWRKLFATLAGMLQAKISAFILDLILSKSIVTYLEAIPFPLNIITIPIIKTTIETAVRAITNPLLSALLSFSTGGRIDRPTLAIIGDAGRLGGRNREWIFNDTQLIALLHTATANGSLAVVTRLERIEKILEQQNLKTYIRGSDIEIVLNRATYERNKRRL